MPRCDGAMPRYDEPMYWYDVPMPRGNAALDGYDELMPRCDETS